MSDYNALAESFRSATNGQNLLGQMRAWVKECIWGDIEHEDEVDALSDAEILRGIDSHYDGGITAFLRDSAPAELAPLLEYPECDNCGAPITRAGLCPVCASCAESVEVVTLVSDLVNPEDLRE